MKRLIIFLLMCICFGIAAVPNSEPSHHHDSGWCQQPITRNTFCPNPPVAGSDFCSEHQRPPAENKKGGGVYDASFSICMNLNPLCFNQAAPGSNYCSLHIPPPPPPQPPAPCTCGVPMPNNRACGQPCVDGIYCKYHRIPPVSN